MRIAVLGPGGVGGLIAALLARAGSDVLVIARESTAEVIAERGLRVQSVMFGELDVRVPARGRLQEEVDVLIVATKAAGLAGALERVEVEPALVLPLLNGLDHIAVLRRRFHPSSVLAGTIRVEADRPEPGFVIHSSPFLLVSMASQDPSARPGMQVLAETLSQAGVPVSVLDCEAQVMWSKLVRLNALACTTSACAKPIGFIRSDPEWREALVGCVTETAAVANADGAQIDPAERLAELDAAHPELGSSMQRDIAAGREPELDAIAGAVLRAGARHGIACPTVARLKAAIEHRIASAGR